jgi:hypothetical protein
MQFFYTPYRKPIAAHPFNFRAPILFKKWHRSRTCGSQAALSITVSPLASTAAITAFSVAVTLASANKQMPRSPKLRGCHFEHAALAHAHARPEGGQSLYVSIKRAAADHISAGNRQPDAAHAGQHRPGKDK